MAEVPHLLREAIAEMTGKGRRHSMPAERRIVAQLRVAG